MEEITWTSMVSFFLIDFLPWLIALSGLHIWAYSKSPKYYFFVLKKLSARKDTKWIVTTTMFIDKEDDFFEIFESNIGNIGKIQRNFNLANKKQYEFGNFSCIILYDIENTNNDIVEVNINFNQMNVTLKNARERLKELRILFNELEKSLQIKRKIYNVDIEFTSMKNPFYGLMIQRVGEEHLTFFQCQFPISQFLKKQDVDSSDDESQITVFREKISVNNNNIDKIESAVSDALLLR
ncbi:hypothetical protein [Alkalicoccus luteus]|uniref:Uncharacterized protein n=1 Tax=Alkalicoccus luteus TaxID=1237094 RepID=A0A969PQL6_9BACI|nr:hypothetical protein [Alkalicoccus luteus]NJP37199.1 hypothetical protein [Alkalicoccus luteus]